MRPLLNPALRALWRDETTLQLGVDAERAVVLAGLAGQQADLLSRLDGTRTTDDLVAAAPGLGLREAAVRELLATLERRGLLVDAGAPAHTGPLPVGERHRLAPDLAAWSVGTGRIERAVLAVRRASTVVVEGAGRLGAALTGLLAAGAVGQLLVADGRTVRPADLGPGGHHGPAVGDPRATSAAAAATAAAPSARVTVSSSLPSYGRDGLRPDLVVLSPDGAVPAAGRCEQLLADGVPHLVATTFERVAVVGPLVLPGRSPCGTCLELHRVDRDPAWPAVAAQLAGPGAPVNGVRGPAACDVVLASLAAAMAASAVLAYLDEPSPSHELCGALVQVRPPSLRARRRSWTLHPGCGCSWQTAGAPVHTEASTRVAPCTSRMRRIGDGSVHSTEATPPAAASSRVGRSPSQAPHQPPARAPSGRIP
jgi:ThiF family